MNTIILAVVTLLATQPQPQKPRSEEVDSAVLSEQVQQPTFRELDEIMKGFKQTDSVVEIGRDFTMGKVPIVRSGESVVGPYRLPKSVLGISLHRAF